MSILDWLDGKAELGLAGDLVKGALGLPTADEKRKQAQAIQGQVDAYKKQTELAQSEIDRKRGEEQIEKRRIEEKQIRSLRHNFKPAGFLDSGDDLASTLGG